MSTEGIQHKGTYLSSASLWMQQHECPHFLTLDKLIVGHLAICMKSHLKMLQTPKTFSHDGVTVLTCLGHMYKWPRNILLTINRFLLGIVLTEVHVAYSLNFCCWHNNKCTLNKPCVPPILFPFLKCSKYNEICRLRFCYLKCCSTIYYQHRSYKGVTKCWAQCFLLTLFLYDSIRQSHLWNIWHSWLVNTLCCFVKCNQSIQEIAAKMQTWGDQTTKYLQAHFYCLSVI